LIVMDVEARDERVPVLRELRQPAVLIGLPDRPSGISCVDLDFAAAGHLAVQHLAEHGHRRVALVGPSPAVYERGTSYATRFRSGFDEAVAQLGLAGAAHACEPTHEGAATCLARVEAKLPGATGFVVHNESVLGPVLSLLRSTGRRLPEDVSIVAVCPEELALDLPVRMTSIDIPAQELGALAVEMVADLLRGRRGVQTRLLAPTLTERDSCADVSHPNRPH
jgi:DNA-binding LacI/PurR family transcriptional regulator